MANLTGRQIILDQLASGIQDDELDYLVEKVGAQKIRNALKRAEAGDEATMKARESMPPTFEINGVTYWRRSQE